MTVMADRDHRIVAGKRPVRSSSSPIAPTNPYSLVLLLCISYSFPWIVTLPPPWAACPSTFLDFS